MIEPSIKLDESARATCNAPLEHIRAEFLMMNQAHFFIKSIVTDIDETQAILFGIQSICHCVL